MKLYPNYKTNHLQTHIPSINHQMHFKSNYCYYEQMHTRVFDYFQNLIVLRNLSCKGMMLSFLFLSLTCNQLISYLMTSTSMVPWFHGSREKENNPIFSPFQLDCNCFKRIYIVNTLMCTRIGNLMLYAINPFLFDIGRWSPNSEHIHASDKYILSFISVHSFAEQERVKI